MRGALGMPHGARGRLRRPRTASSASSACCAGRGLRPRTASSDFVLGRVAARWPPRTAGAWGTHPAQLGGGWPPVDTQSGQDAGGIDRWPRVVSFLPGKGPLRDAPSGDGDAPLSQGAHLPGGGGGAHARVLSLSLSPSPNAPNTPRQGVGRQRLSEPGDCLSLEAFLAPRVKSTCSLCGANSSTWERETALSALTSACGAPLGRVEGIALSCQPSA